MVARPGLSVDALRGIGGGGRWWWVQCGVLHVDPSMVELRAFRRFSGNPTHAPADCAAVALRSMALPVAAARVSRHFIWCVRLLFACGRCVLWHIVFIPLPAPAVVAAVALRSPASPVAAACVLRHMILCVRHFTVHALHVLGHIEMVFLSAPAGVAAVALRSPALPVAAACVLRHITLCVRPLTEYALHVLGHIEVVSLPAPAGVAAVALRSPALPVAAASVLWHICWSVKVGLWCMLFHTCVVAHCCVETFCGCVSRHIMLIHAPAVTAAALRRPALPVAAAVAQVCCAVVWFLAGCGPSAGVRFGEARVPGPSLRIAQCNVTALEPLVSWAVALPFDVLVLIETKVRPGKKAGVEAQFRRAGWNVVSSPATLGPGGGPSGGLLVAAKGPRSVFAPKVREPGAAAQEHRWMHVVVEGGSGEQPIHFLPVYCYPRGTTAHLELQTSVLTEVFEYAAGLGDVPVAVLGDFNAEPDESPYLVEANPHWAVLPQVEAKGTVRPSGRRIDFAVANRAYRLRASSETVWGEGVTSPHDGVWHGYNSGQIGLRPMLRTPTDLGSIDAEQAQACFASLAAAHFWPMVAHITHNRVEEAWELWCRWAEQALRGNEVPDSSKASRGQPPQVKWVKAQAPSIRPEWGATSAAAHAALLMHRRLRALAHLRSRPISLADVDERRGLLRALEASMLQAPEPWPTRAARLYSVSRDNLQEWVGEAASHLKACQRTKTLERVKAWRETVARNARTRPGKVFSWCRGAFVPAPSGVVSSRGIVVSVTEVIEGVKAHWNRWWGAEPIGSDEDLCGLRALAAANPLPPLGAEELWRIARSVSSHKAAGPDNWAFGELRLLPLDAFRVLADLFALFERLGQWPEGLRGAIVVQVPKPGAADATGLRPIGLMASVYRLWAAARVPVLRGWLRSVDAAIVGGRPGVGADVAALETAVLACTAVAEGDAVAAAFLDITKAYEGVDLRLLARAAVQQGFPAVVAHMAIEAYRGPRRIRFCGAVAPEPVYASRGITAGCACAVSLMGLYLLPVLQAARGPCIQGVRGYVDDVSFLSVGAARPAAIALGQAIDRATVALRGIGLDWTESKFQLVGSDRCVHQHLTHLRGDTVVHSARDLGTDFGLAGRRLPVQQARIQEAAARAARVAMLPLPRLSKEVFVRAAVLQTCLFGVGLVGISDTVVGHLRAMAAKALAGNGGSLLARTVLLQIGKGLDPGVEAHLQVLKLWARLWRLCPTLVALVGEAWHLSRASGGKAGLVTDVLYTALVKAGFRPAAAADLWIDLEGRVWVAQHFGWLHVAEAHLKRELWLRAEAQRAELQGLGGIPLVGSFATLRKAHRQGHRAEAGLRLVCLAGGTWTPDRVTRHFRQGLTGQAGCRHCGAPQADEAHRWWVCPRWDAVRVAAGLSALAQPAIAAHFYPACLWLCGLASAKGCRESGAMRSTPQLAIGGISLEGQGVRRAFSDGSALNPTIPEVRRAGWGVFFGPQSRACGPLPGPAQTINRAELWALCNLAAARPPVAEAHLDSTVTVAGARRVAAGDIPAINADLWVIYLACFAPGTAVHYVPAHLTAEEAEARGVEAELRNGNAEADRLARVGAEAHAVPADEVEEVRLRLAFADQVQSVHWRVLREACKAEPMRALRRAPRAPRGACGPFRRRGPPPSLSVGAHDLEQGAGGVVCRRCGRRGRLGGPARSWRQRPCTPLLRAHVGGAAAHGHVLWERDGRVGCDRCGRDMAKVGRSRLIHAKCVPRLRPIPRARGNRASTKRPAPEGHILALLAGSKPAAARRLAADWPVASGGVEAQGVSSASSSKRPAAADTEALACGPTKAARFWPPDGGAGYKDKDVDSGVEAEAAPRACGPLPVVHKRRTTAGPFGAPLAGAPGRPHVVGAVPQGERSCGEPRPKRPCLEGQATGGRVDMAAFFRALPCAERGIVVDEDVGAAAQAGDEGAPWLPRGRPPEGGIAPVLSGAVAQEASRAASEGVGPGGATEVASCAFQVAGVRPALAGDS